MKKKIAIFVLTLAIAALTALTAAAMNVTEFSTSNGEYGFKFKITDSGIDVSGCIKDEDTFVAYIQTDKAYVVNIAPDVTFDTAIGLPTTSDSEIDVVIGLGESIKSGFIPIYEKNDITLKKADGKWYFNVNDKVYEKNAAQLDNYVYHGNYLGETQPSAVKLIIHNVTKGLNTDYEKAMAINKWIADNIYYDNDYTNGKTDKTAIAPIEVLQNRITVCEGYANLAIALLNAAGIPAIPVKGYINTFDSEVSWDYLVENVSENHMWVEAYTDGRWITMDPTRDSLNRYSGGKRVTTYPPAYPYFDASPIMLSSKHLIIDRPDTFGELSVSSWAEKEVAAAFDRKLVTPEIQVKMNEKITREEFCDLVVNLLTVKRGKSIGDILAEKGLELDRGFFKDTEDTNILSANALGIVNGKENNMFDPSGFITRDEAAAMLQRTARVLGATKPNGEKFEFSDASKFQEWAVVGIEFVSASVSSEGTRVMGGVENNKFDPKGFYTKEQSVLTVYRLFNTY